MNVMAAIRRVRRVDLLLAVGAGVIAIGATAVAAGHQDRGPMPVGGALLLALGAVSLLARRRYPVTVLAIALGSTMLYWSLGYPRGPVFGSLIIAFVTAVMAGRRREAIASIIVGYLGFLWLGAVFDREDRPSVGGFVALATWLALLTTASEIARSRRDRALERERSRVAEAHSRATEERLRIARELHDVVAHNISLINVQAGVALHLMNERPDQATLALTAIKQASKEALVELRSVLGVLRQVDDGAPRAPAPGLSQLPALVERARAAGLTIEVEIDGQPAALPAGVDLAAFRIVQEAITNVARHAGVHDAIVRVHYADAAISVEILDEGIGSLLNGSADEGNGLIGMRERAEALGGELTAGPRPGRGFAVRARLPIHEATE